MLHSDVNLKKNVINVVFTFTYTIFKIQTTAPAVDCNIQNRDHALFCPTVLSISGNFSELYSTENIKLFEFEN